MYLKIIGALLVAFGLTDMIGSYNGLDVWNDWFQVELPELLWQFSSYIEIALGVFLWRKSSPEEVEE